MTQSPLNPNQQQVQQIVGLYSEGRLDEVVEKTTALLLEFSRSSFLYTIQGASLLAMGQFDAAIASYNQALKLDPNDAKTYFNLGAAQHASGAIDTAIESYEQAVSIDPEYVLAFNNLGNALKDNSDLDRAISSYRKALAIDPEFAEVYTNLGNAEKDRGALDSAIDCYQQALRLRPNYAEAYNNMGSAFNEKAEVERARECYQCALKISPDFADAAWNMVGTAHDPAEARAWTTKCLDIDPDYLSASIQRALLDYAEGDRARLDSLLSSELSGNPVLRSAEWLLGLPYLPQIHFNRWAFFDSVAAMSKQDRPFYEFGVFRGEAFRYLIKTFNKGYGFDTFEGLPKDWHDEKAGAYSSEGSVPVIDGGEFIAGKFEESLQPFFSVPRPVASLINFDADLYSSTLCALENSHPVIDADTILIFDEFIVNEKWEEDEFRALNEFCQARGLSFDVLAVSFITKQVAVKLQGI